MNEELDDAAVTAAVAGYPRTGRDLADGYMLAALVIRATYDPLDPEIKRALRLYTGDWRRLEALGGALADVAECIDAEINARRVRERRASGELADAASTVLLPRVPTQEDLDAQRELNERAAMRRVPGEVTQEIRRPVGPPPHEYRAQWSGADGCMHLWMAHEDAGTPEHCGRPYGDPVHGDSRPSALA